MKLHWHPEGSDRQEDTLCGRGYDAPLFAQIKRRVTCSRCGSILGLRRRIRAEDRQYLEDGKAAIEASRPRVRRRRGPT